MKAISLTRPWTTLVLRHGKDVENRTWSTSYRGPLVIHGALSWDPDAYDFARRIADAGGYGTLDMSILSPRANDFVSGYLGVVDLIDVCARARDGDPTRRARCGCGPWAMCGQYHWKLANPRGFPEPIPGKGRLGLWSPPAEVWAAAAVAEAVARG